MKTRTRLRLAAASALVIVGAVAAPAPAAQAHWTGWTHEHCDRVGCWRTCGWLDFWCKPGYTTPVRPFPITY